MPRAPSNKSEVLLELYNLCKARGSLAFTDKEVKVAAERHGFKNSFDVAKIDHSVKLPDAMQRDDMAVLRLGEGKFTFVKGINLMYHQFEEIPPESIKTENYITSLLNHTDTSESSLLSLVYNQRTLHNFLYKNHGASPRIYMARRTNMRLQFQLGEQVYKSGRMQMEMDMVLELEGRVTVFEGKNRFHDDFDIFQLYKPFRYYKKLQQQGIKIRRIDCCYVAREACNKKHPNHQIVRLHLYEFTDLERPDSIVLKNFREYELGV